MRQAHARTNNQRSSQLWLAARGRFALAALAFSMLAAVLGACATTSTTERVYGPEQVPAAVPQPGTSAQPETLPAASFPIPAGAPKGTAYVMSFGGESLGPPSGQSGFFLHLRVAAENSSDDVPWTINANDQKLVTGAGGTESPAYAQGSMGGPAVTLTKGQRGYMDVYFPFAAAGGPPQVALSWTVRRGSEPVTNTASFQVVAGAAPQEVSYYRPVYDSSVTLVYWPVWWWGFDYPWVWGPGWWWHHPHRFGYWHGGRVFVPERGVRGWAAPPPRAGGWHGVPAHPHGGGWHGGHGGRR